MTHYCCHWPQAYITIIKNGLVSTSSILSKILIRICKYDVISCVIEAPKCIEQMHPKERVSSQSIECLIRQVRSKQGLNLYLLLQVLSNVFTEAVPHHKTQVSHDLNSSGIILISYCRQYNIQWYSHHSTKSLRNDVHYRHLGKGKHKLCAQTSLF